MIDVETARQLRQAGLEWQPRERDCFAVPGGELEGQVFVVSQLTTLVGPLRGEQTITFHGSSEWALDYLLTADAVWLPSETQLRESVERLGGPGAALSLAREGDGYVCRIGALAADGPTAEAAYAGVLLALLRRQQT